MFQITALDAEAFRPLFALDDAALARHKARRVVADADFGFPCRVSLQDAAAGDRLILVNHQHLVGDTPYAASHAIYVREGAERDDPAPGVIPDMLSRRLLSVRAFDARQLMVDADVVDGTALGPALERLFAVAAVDVIHVHLARPGCFAARATRA